MRDAKRIEPIMKVITDIWKKYPDMRLGQLLMNTCFNFSGKNYKGEHIENYIWNQEDEETLVKLMESVLYE